VAFSCSGQVVCGVRYYKPMIRTPASPPTISTSAGRWAKSPTVTTPGI
jgi:hypothetical protein